MQYILFSYYINLQILQVNYYPNKCNCHIQLVGSKCYLEKHLNPRKSRKAQTLPREDYAAAAAAKLLQSCPTLCDPIDSSPPGSPVPGILQARTLEWVVISFSNAWKWKVRVKSLSRVRLLATPWTTAYQAPQSMGFSRQKYWSGVPLPSPREDYSWKQLLTRVMSQYILREEWETFKSFVKRPHKKAFSVIISKHLRLFSKNKLNK